MFDSLDLPPTPGKPDYSLLASQARSLIEGESDLIANLANIAALLYASLQDINWAGFYLWREDRQALVLGPFQGRPACVTIASGSGVCGAAFASGKTQRVADVHAFPGHIACDAASKSEIVVPVSVSGKVLAVLDIDSPRAGRFEQADQTGLEQFCRLLAEELSW